MIAGIVLAAGRSTRMGRPKVLLPLADGRPMLAHAIDALRQGGAAPVLVMTRDQEGVTESVLQAGARPIRVEGPGSGEMLASLQKGLEVLLESPVEAALVHPGDMPFVQAATVRSLLDLWMLERSPVLAPSFRNRRGHPVCLARETWRDILVLQPSASLRDYLRQRSADIRYLVVDDEGVVQDVDRPEDYDQAVAQGSS